MSIPAINDLGTLMLQLFQLNAQKIKVPEDYYSRVDEVNKLLDNDYTGIVSTIIEFMVQAGTVSFMFETKNSNLDKILNDQWAKNINSGVSVDIQSGLRTITTDYLRERYRSSFIALNIVWEDTGSFILPSKMWIADGSELSVKGTSAFGSNKYFLGRKEKKPLPLAGTDVLIRKPFCSSYKKEPVPYLVAKGTLYHAMMKKLILSKQAIGAEEIIPYLLLLQAGNDVLATQNKLGGIQEKLDDLKEKLIDAQNNRKLASRPGHSVVTGRYDFSVDHLIPELTKLFDEKIMNGTDKNLMSSLGLIELQGFGDTRQEAILNPKVLVEEVVDAVGDLSDLYKDVLLLIVKKNLVKHRNLSQGLEKTRVISGVIKPMLTKAMQDMIMDASAKGILSIEDTFQGLPSGFDFEVSKIRRMQEKANGDEETFLPRPILNQNTNEPPSRVPTPEETPQNVPEDNNEETEGKNKKTKKLKLNYGSGDMIFSPYENIDQLPDSVKSLPIPAKLIFLRVVNEALNDEKTEEGASELAWAAVKKIYFTGDDGVWKKKK